MTVGKRLVIVGSGPVGMVAALLLRNQFERVVLLERQSKERFLRTRGYTFPIVLSPAAIAVLQRVGVWDAIRAERSPSFGVVVHKRLLGGELSWTAKRDGGYSHWRNHIVSSLYEKVCAEGIHVVFEADVTGIDFADNVCTESSLGDISFDLLLGADGMHSVTRRFIAEAHPEYDAGRFTTTMLDRWYAYRLPSTGALAERFDGGDDHYALHVHVSNVAEFAHDKFRLITVAMQQPRDEISIVVKYGRELSLERVREINNVVFAPLVDEGILDAEWTNGFGGTYDHVDVPTFHVGAALLVGDAAHGFEGNGDLINLGIGSVAALAETIAEHDTIQAALAKYDRTVGRALRDYAKMALRRSHEKLNFEVAAFEAGALLRLNRHHPSMWGIYEDDFEIVHYMAWYRRHRERVKVVAGAVTAIAGLLLLRSLRRT